MPKSNVAKLETLTTLLITDKTLYLALYETSPNGDNTGTEVFYTGYVRQPIVWGTPEINGGVGQAKNTNLIEFEIVPNSSGTVAHVAILDATPAGGNLVYYAPLSATYSLEQGVKPTIPIGALTIFEV